MNLENMIKTSVTKNQVMGSHRDAQGYLLEFCSWEGLVSGSGTTLEDNLSTVKITYRVHHTILLHKEKRLGSGEKDSNVFMY